MAAKIICLASVAGYCKDGVNARRVAAVDEGGQLSDRGSGSQHTRDVVSGFERQHTHVWQLIEVLSVRPQDCRTDVGFSRVVGGQREPPVAELRIQIVKVACRSVGCLEEVEAIILNLVHTQSVMAGSIRHQLPKTASALRGERCGASSTLDKDD